MKTRFAFAIVACCVAPLTTPAARAAAAEENAVVTLARSVVKADRQAVVRDSLQLLPEEANKFWPLYQAYRTEMDRTADGLEKVVLDYAALYPNVPDQRATAMLRSVMDIEKNLVAIRSAHLKKISKVLPPEKTLRFAQIENRLDLALRLKLAAGVPWVPIEGRIAATASGAAGYAEGVPGGLMVQTTELSARVIGIDSAKRQVTLLGGDGIKETVTIGPEAINFDQVRIGDSLQITATEAIVVEMGTPGQRSSTGTASAVVLAPKGAKPGGVMAETIQIAATIQAVDARARKVTVRLADGSTRVLPVRPDIDLTQRKAGEQVVLRHTEVLAIRVSKR